MASKLQSLKPKRETTMTVDGISIDIERKSVKYLRLAVRRPDGRVRVSAPRRMSEESIRGFILLKLPWIKKKRELFSCLKVLPLKEYVSGESHFFLGESYGLRVVPILGRESVQHVEAREGLLLLYAQEDATKEKKEAILRAWYRERLASVLKDLVGLWEEKLDVKVDSMEIRLMKSRWGTCYKARGKVLFNLKLAEKPLRCVEYVVAHELAHLIEANHSERFKRILDTHLPQWRALRKELNEVPL